MDIYNQQKKFVYELDEQDESKLLEGLCLLTSLHGVSIDGVEGVVFRAPIYRNLFNQYPLDIDSKSIKLDSRLCLDYDYLRDSIRSSVKETLLLGRNYMGGLECALYIGRQVDSNPFTREIYLNNSFGLKKD